LISSRFAAGTDEVYPAAALYLPLPDFIPAQQLAPTEADARRAFQVLLDLGQIVLLDRQMALLLMAREAQLAFLTLGEFRILQTLLYPRDMLGGGVNAILEVFLAVFQSTAPCGNCLIQFKADSIELTCRDTEPGVRGALYILQFLVADMY